ncbi:unnamed protein product [Closterium sp. NIES-64]|nr:unnamed protein product [Closterium sp. NIES-64]
METTPCASEAGGEKRMGALEVERWMGPDQELLLSGEGIAVMAGYTVIAARMVGGEEGLPVEEGNVELMRVIRRTRETVHGAGVSAASGVPTFRGAGGLWRSYDATELATPQAFAADPSLVWEFYHYRRCCPPAAYHHYSHFLPSATTAGSCLKSVVARCTPNAGHEALVQLEFRCQREGKAFTLLTQHRNVDGLPCSAGAVTSSAACTIAVTCALVLPARPCCTPRCALAACPPSPPTHRHPSPSPGKPQNVDGLHTAAGRSALVELHGCLWRTRCLASPSEGAKAASIALKDLPRCTKLPGSAASSRPCNGLLRPDVVWFGECLDPRVVQAAEDALTGCDLLLIVGTSGVVHALTGASSRVCLGGAGGRGAGAEFNAEATALSPLATWKFPGDSAMLLPLVLG